MPIGTLFLKGEFNNEERATEWFEMSTEMSTGHSYSHYRIELYLEPASEAEEKTVYNYLDSKYR